MTITEFLLARIAEDEAIAQAAIVPGRPGTHWQWVTTEDDTPVKPGEESAALRHQNLSLRTVEEFPIPNLDGLPLPAFALDTVEELGAPGVGQHITTHDPARVLAECEAKRRIIKAYERLEDYRYNADAWGMDYPEETILWPLAAVYSDHPDFRQEWAVAE